MSIPDFKEEFKTWRDRYTLSQLMTCLWTRQEREKFWNAARSVEMLKTVCFGKPAASTQATPHHKESGQQIVYQQEVLQQSQPCTPPPTPVSIGGTFRSPHKKPAGKNRAVKRLCDRINKLQQSTADVGITDEIFTIPFHSTLELGEIYNGAADGVIPDDGLTGPSIVGVPSSEERKVQEEIEHPRIYHKAVVRSWGFNFNDSPFGKKRNLYHVIYTGEHNDHLYMDMRETHKF